MYRLPGYALFFVMLLALQIFFFGNIDMGTYIHPLVYVTFIIMLPIETPAVAVLLLGLVTGVTMDFFTGDGGINTIATLLIAFMRLLVLNLVLGRDEVGDGGVPSPQRIGCGKFFRYSLIMVTMHCLVYFTFESLSWQYYYLTLLRAGLSAVVTVVLVFFCQMLLVGGHPKQQVK